jgi:hypothetical protein
VRGGGSGFPVVIFLCVKVGSHGATRVTVERADAMSEAESRGSPGVVWQVCGDDAVDARRSCGDKLGRPLSESGQSDACTTPQIPLNFTAQSSCSSLNSHLLSQAAMDSAIDLTDAEAKALDLANIRFQLMYAPSTVYSKFKPHQKYP